MVGNDKTCTAWQPIPTIANSVLGGVMRSPSNNYKVWFDELDTKHQGKIDLACQFAMNRA